VPARGFLGTPDQLAHAVGGQLISEEPGAAWILVPGAPARADRYFPLAASTGDRIWYRDGMITTCA
jgi:hypothetical protein